MWLKAFLIAAVLGIPGASAEPPKEAAQKEEQKAMAGMVVVNPFSMLECTGSCLNSEDKQRKEKEFLVYEELVKAAQRKGEAYCRSQSPPPPKDSKKKPPAECTLLPLDPKASCNQAEALGQCTVSSCPKDLVDGKCPGPTSDSIKYIRCSMKCAIACDCPAPEPEPPARLRDSGYKKARPKTQAPKKPARTSQYRFTSGAYVDVPRVKPVPETVSDRQLQPADPVEPEEPSALSSDG